MAVHSLPDVWLVSWVLAVMTVMRTRILSLQWLLKTVGASLAAKFQGNLASGMILVLKNTFVARCNSVFVARLRERFLVKGES